MERESGTNLPLQTRKSSLQRTKRFLRRLPEIMHRSGAEPRSAIPSPPSAVGSAGKRGREPAAAPDLPGRGLVTRHHVSPVWRPIGSPLPPFSRVGELVAGPEGREPSRWRQRRRFRQSGLVSVSCQLLHSGSIPRWRETPGSWWPLVGAESDSQVPVAD